MLIISFVVAPLFICLCVSVCIVLLLVDQLKRRLGVKSVSSRVGLDQSWRASDDADHQKVYLLAPTPGQKWTSDFSHFSPSAAARPIDQHRLHELLTPSKDWWSGHKTGTPADLNENDLAAMPKLEFGDVTVSQSSASKKMSRRSRNSTQQHTAPQVEEEQVQVKQSSYTNAELDDEDDYGVAAAGDDGDDGEDGDEVSLTQSTSSSSRKSIGTPSRHRRQWTHTIVPGIEEARIHRKGKQLF